MKFNFVPRFVHMLAIPIFILGLTGCGERAEDFDSPAPLKLADLPNSPDSTSDRTASSGASQAFRHRYGCQFETGEANQNIEASDSFTEPIELEDPPHAELAPDGSGSGGSAFAIWKYDYSGQSGTGNVTVLTQWEAGLIPPRSNVYMALSNYATDMWEYSTESSLDDELHQLSFVFDREGSNYEFPTDYISENGNLYATLIVLGESPFTDTYNLHWIKMGPENIPPCFTLSATPSPPDSGDLVTVSIDPVYDHDGSVKNTGGILWNLDNDANFAENNIYESSHFGTTEFALTDETGFSFHIWPGTTYHYGVRVIDNDSGTAADVDSLIVTGTSNPGAGSWAMKFANAQASCQVVADGLASMPEVNYFFTDSEDPDFWLKGYLGPISHYSDGTALLKLDSSSDKLVAVHPNGIQRWSYSSSSFSGSDGDHVATDSSGNVYFAAGDKLISISNTGALRWTFDSTASNLYDPVIRQDGNIVVLDSSKDVHCINSSNGSELTNFPNTGITAYTPEMIAVDDSNNIYVTQAGNSTIHKISANGSTLTSTSVSGGNVVKGNNLCVSGDVLFLLVLDSPNSAIVLVSLDLTDAQLDAELYSRQTVHTDYNVITDNGLHLAAWLDGEDSPEVFVTHRGQYEVPARAHKYLVEESNLVLDWSLPLATSADEEQSVYVTNPVIDDDGNMYIAYADQNDPGAEASPSNSKIVRIGNDGTMNWSYLLASNSQPNYLSMADDGGLWLQQSGMLWFFR